MDIFRCNSGCGTRVKRKGLNCSKCPYHCIAGCGRIVKKNGFYCKKCWPRCDAPVYMDLQPCLNRVKKEGLLCNRCRRIDLCDRCGRRSLKADGSCKFCVYKCDFDNCWKYVRKNHMFCNYHYEYTRCPVPNCDRYVAIGNLFCKKCQCKTKGCTHQKLFGKSFCINCKSAWLLFWAFHLDDKSSIHFPLEIVIHILRFAKMAIPKIYK